MPPHKYSPGPERGKTVALRVSLQLIVCPLNPHSQHNALTSRSIPQTPSPTRTGWGLRHSCSEACWHRYEPLESFASDGPMRLSISHFTASTW